MNSALRSSYKCLQTPYILPLLRGSPIRQTKRLQTDHQPQHSSTNRQSQTHRHHLRTTRTRCLRRRGTSTRLASLSNLQSICRSRGCSSTDEYSAHARRRRARSAPRPRGPRRRSAPGPGGPARPVGRRTRAATPPGGPGRAAPVGLG